MQSAETVLGVLRERGRRGLPCGELYRQLFNPQLYLLAYGRVYSNHGSMTPGATQETADGMCLEKIDAIIEAMRHERYRFAPVRRVHIPKKNGKLRPLGLPSWSDKLVGEVVRLLLEAYYEPQFSERSHGFRPGRGCHTALHGRSKIDVVRVRLEDLEGSAHISGGPSGCSGDIAAAGEPVCTDGEVVSSVDSILSLGLVDVREGQIRWGGQDLDGAGGDPT